MDDLLDRIDAERAWAAVVVGIAAVLTIGSILFPRQVYDQFVWKYYWGPVAADGENAACAVREDGSTTYLDSAQACTEATGVVAEPGYTIVSTVSYAVLLILLLGGVYFLIQRIGVEARVEALYPLFPWVLFGGALRTLEDANVALEGAGSSLAVPFPYTAAIISPFIYVFVFLLAVVAIVASVWAAGEGHTERWEYPFAATGAALFALAVGTLLFLSATSDALGFNPVFFLVVVAGATAAAAAFWVVTERRWPVVNAGTGFVGVLVVWGHAIDGFANVLSLDHNEVFGLPGYSPKHVVNEAVGDITGAIQPEWLNDLVGPTWPFIPLKVVAAGLVVWLFNDEMIEETPRYSVLLLLAVLAVGLGPGTRDLLRATFAI